MFQPAGLGGHSHEPAVPITIAMGGGSLTAPAADGSRPLRRHPDWIRSRLAAGENYHQLKDLLRGLEKQRWMLRAHRA